MANDSETLTVEFYIHAATQQGLDFLNNMSAGTKAVFSERYIPIPQNHQANRLSKAIDRGLALSGYQFNSALKDVFDLAPFCGVQVSRSETGVTLSKPQCRQ